MFLYDQLLGSLDFRNVLKRGFALIRSKKDKVLNNIKDIKEEVEFIIEVRDGKVNASIENS